MVYGDLGTSPLYVFYNTFPHGVDDTEDIIGALSLIIYSLTLIPLLKYVFIVCRANDNGQGKVPLSDNYLLWLCFCVYNVEKVKNGNSDNGSFFFGLRRGDFCTLFFTLPAC